jgi:hypothetical protein
VYENIDAAGFSKVSNDTCSGEGLGREEMGKRGETHLGSITRGNDVIWNARSGVVVMMMVMIERGVQR